MILTCFDNKNTGPIVLFIHGTASSNEVWQNQYNLLKNTEYRLVGIDLRGHGSSANKDSSGNLEDHLTDLKETLDYLKIDKPATIIGHSFGAVLAIKFAERYPNSVKKLLLVSLPTKISPILHKYYKWLLGKPLELVKENCNFLEKLPLQKTAKLAIKADISVVRKIWSESKKWDFLNQTPKVLCPIHLSVGRFDYIALKSRVVGLHKKLPNSTCKVFNWASHNCIEQARDEFNKWISILLTEK